MESIIHQEMKLYESEKCTELRKRHQSGYSCCCQLFSSARRVAMEGVPNDPSSINPCFVFCNYILLFYIDFCILYLDNFFSLTNSLQVAYINPCFLNKLIKKVVEVANNHQSVILYFYIFSTPAF